MIPMTTKSFLYLRFGRELHLPTTTTTNTTTTTTSQFIYQTADTVD
jgi:hypothetical protein